jgi:hypothetical protein
MPRLVEDLLTVYFNGKDEDGFYTGITGNKVTESTLTKIILNDVLGFANDISSVPIADRLVILKSIIEGSVFDPDKGSPLLNVKNAGVNTFHEYVEQTKQQSGEYFIHAVRNGFFSNLSKRLISDASDRALYSNYKKGILGELGWKITNRGNDGGSSKTVSTAIAVAEGYDTVVFLRNKYGHNKDLQSGSSYYNKLVDWKSEHYYKLVEELGAIGTKLGEPLTTKHEPMQTRSLFRMDNPLVVEGRKEYKEYFLKDKIRPALAAGHDGIVFREMRDGGNFDNIYIIFKDGLKDNQLGLDTSFDDVAVPRGNDENGEKVRYGKDLGLAFQPDDIDAPKQLQGIKMDMTKAYDVFRQEYEESTGQSWTQDKFMQRAKNWQFFGDENGFVAVRPQRSGFIKLVGMAGDNKSKLRGIQQLQEQKLPVWGMVSKDIKDIAVKRGMREPNMIERPLLKMAISNASLGDAEILGYTSDNGIRIRYPDVGEVTKYMIGSPEYYQKLRSQFGEQIKNKIGFQPDEGGRVYDQNSREFKTGFIGKWAEKTPERLKDYDLEFIDRGTKYGTHNVRIRLQDNSVKGETADVGHITADIDPKTKVASLSSNIGVKYRGNKLSYALYSEMAERLRSMGVEKVDGTIINPDGVPIKVREKIIGNTRVLNSDGSSGVPVDYKQGARIIQRKQAEGLAWDGLDVVNELDPNARYQPSESWEKTRELGMKSTWNNLPEVSRKLLQLNIDTFGLTNNAYEAGYILPDARMLDFSGRSQTSGFKRVNGKNVPKTKFDEFKDSRQIDHREVVMLPEEKKKMQEEYGWEEDKIGRMQQAGAIRIDHNDYGADDGRTYLDIGSIPTNKQYEAILDILKNSVKNKEKHTLGVDIRVDGKAINHPLHDVSLENPERAILALKREINKAYKNNETGKDKASMQPTEGEQGGSAGKAQYEIDQQIVDRLKKSFKFPAKLLTVKDMLQFIIDNDGHMSPLAKEMIGSLDDHGLGALIKQQTTTLGSSQKGVKGETFHNFHPAHNSAFMVLERNLERRKQYNNVSYEYLMMEEMLHSLTTAKTPEPIRHGSTIEDTLKNVEHFLKNKEKYSEKYDQGWKMVTGFSEEWWTVSDAYKKVHNQFSTGKYLDGSEMTKSEKHIIAYRLSNIGEFMIGITQSKAVQKILSQIKVPKKEGGLLSNILNAIKKIWGFGDEAMGSLLEHTSDAMEKVIKRQKSDGERYDSGRHSERAKRYFDGMPKFQPAEGWRDWQSERTSVGSVIKNTAGYVIMVQGDKFKVYNPYKAMIGIYDNEDQAKRRVQKDEPRR